MRTRVFMLGKMSFINQCICFVLLEVIGVGVSWTEHRQGITFVPSMASRRAWRCQLGYNPLGLHALVVTL
jgi:hypothetical protein